MPIPTTDEMVLPVLQYIADGQEYRRLKIINMLTEHFSLTEDERRHLGKSGKMETSLSHKGLIERSKPKHYRITDHGLEILNQNSEGIPASDGNTETIIDSPTVSAEVNGNTPTSEKSIEENYQQIRKELAADCSIRLRLTLLSFSRNWLLICSLRWDTVVHAKMRGKLLEAVVMVALMGSLTKIDWGLM